MALQLGDDRHPALALLAMARPLGQQQSAQRIGIGGERIRSRHHVRSESHHGIRVAAQI